MADEEALKAWKEESDDVSDYERLQAELMLLRNQKKYIDQLSKEYDKCFNLLFDLDKTEQNRSRLIWYLDNDQRQKVASGIYVYIAEYKGDRKIGKLALAR